MTALDTLFPADVGERLRIARDNADITQKDQWSAKKLEFGILTYESVS